VYKGIMTAMRTMRRKIPMIWMIIPVSPPVFSAVLWITCPVIRRRIPQKLLPDKPFSVLYSRISRKKGLN
jgi:hypothetical protein